MADEPAAPNPLDQLRLTLMQEVLPVGLGWLNGRGKVARAGLLRCSPLELPILLESYARKGNRQPALSAISWIR